MRLSPEKFVVVGVLLLAIVLELIYVLEPRNLSADPYRFVERQKAFGEWGRQRTPELKAVWDHERELLHDHHQRITFLVIVAAVMEGVVVAVIVRRSILRRSRENAG